MVARSAPIRTPDQRLRVLVSLTLREPERYGLEGFVGLRAGRDDVREAGLLFGAAETLRRKGIVNTGAYAFAAVPLGALRAAGAGDALDAAVEEGRGLTVGEALAHATDRGRGDDRTLPIARVVAIVLVPFLAAVAVILFAFPARTGELFAWPIEPPLSAAVLASAYVGGIWFFARVPRRRWHEVRHGYPAVVVCVPRRRWHEVRHGYPAVVVCAGALLVATLLHLDRFPANLSFAVWMALYATTPFVAAALAVIQRPRDPGIPRSVDIVLPRFVRAGLVRMGLASAATGAVLLIAPQAAIPTRARRRHVARHGMRPARARDRRRIFRVRRALLPVSALRHPRPTRRTATSKERS